MEAAIPIFHPDAREDSIVGERTTGTYDAHLNVRLGLAPRDE